ncbi:hypothetical protein [Flavobacterium columnare]|uniref:hypothetical protein n=1 Tax=Flavobacterium TaxID=237 RepID=UPI000B5BE050|nr:hypothetical protein B0A56_00685 [Flavobacterium columnare NBRC 100251 = ATCC 23463]
MLRLSSEITIQGDATWVFYAVHTVKIIEDIGTLTDTCEIELPKKIVWESKEKGIVPIKRGDAITVKLGYDNELDIRFTGFIRSVDAKSPVRIKCEDGMFLLKQKKAEPKAFKKANLNDVIVHLLNGTTISYQLIENIALGSYRITKPTIAEALQELKEKHMLQSYFRVIDGKSVLYIGLAYPTDGKQRIYFKHGKNIISESFEYRDVNEIRAKVEATSFGAKHKKTYVEVGDTDGDVIKIRIDGLTEAELKKYANQALERYKQSGFKGSFETFGQPMVRKCDEVEIFASDGNSGTYLVKKNEIDFGVNGFRQKIELGQPLNINLK